MNLGMVGVKSSVLKYILIPNLGIIANFTLVVTALAALYKCMDKTRFGIKVDSYIDV
jgi:hypothetical protein